MLKEANTQHSSLSNRLLRDTEMAALLGVSRRFVHTLKARGVLRAVRLGNCLRFPEAENMARVLSEGASPVATGGAQK